MMALDLDGVDDKITHGDINSIDGTASLTISAWSFSDTVGGNEVVVAKDITASGVGLRWKLDGPGTKYSCHVDGTGNLGTTPDEVVTGRWDHWAWVFNGAGSGNAARLLCYLNGRQQTLAFTGTIEAAVANSGAEPVLVGQSNSGGNGSSLDAKIAHVKIWTAVLSASAIGQEMWSYRPIQRANLVLWVPYDDSTRARDYSGNGNHGTVTGALYVGGPAHMVVPQRFPTLKHARRVERPGGRLVGLWGHKLLL